MATRWLLALTFVLAASTVQAGDKTDKSIHPRPLEEIKKTLKAILAPGDKKADEKTQALQRLKAYRYLCEVPYEDLTLDEEYNKACQAGARLCEKIGKLDHKPENPEWPEEEYKLAFKGTSQSNLGQGFKSLVPAVDAWMDDSDAGNIDRLGHRRWCLNPTMAKTGFGRSGIFTAMYSFDRNRKKVPDYNLICYPARGYMPTEFFGPKYAWSVSLNPKKYKAPGKDYAPKVHNATAAGEKEGDPLPLDYKNVDTLGFGVNNCIIFRPERVSVKAGARYAVELEDIRLQTGKTVTLRYVVEFVKWK